LTRKCFPTSAFVVAGFVIACGAATVSAQSLRSGEMFDPAAAVGGITIPRDRCADLERQETGAWVQVDGEGYCLRYYASGLKPAPGPNPVVAGWLHGDVMGKHEGPADKHMKDLGVNAMVDQERELSQRFGVPFIFLARPGSYGSAGRHFTMRSRVIEGKLIDAFLDALKARYGVESWALGGHSGGGTLVAQMLTERTDLRCAIISSGAANFRAYLTAHHSPGADSPVNLDPYSDIGKIQTAGDQRIFVIGDPRDENVYFFTQQLYFDGLKKRNLPAWLLPLEKAPTPEYHSLVDFGETAAGLCANGAPTNQIIKTLQAMPDQRLRVSN
jgi:pimeloyl-ACP methyl ester carboxylesterase